MYPSFEELRSDRQRVVFSEALNGSAGSSGMFPSALSVMKTIRSALQEMEPLQRGDGSWHELSAADGAQALDHQRFRSYAG